MRIMIVALTVLLLLATGALAAEENGVFRPADGSVLPALRVDADCTIGSTDFAGYQGWYDNFWSGNETYATLVQPTAEGCDCNIGFQVVAIHMLIKANQFASFDVRVLLYEAVDLGGGGLAARALIANGQAGCRCKKRKRANTSKGGSHGSLVSSAKQYSVARPGRTQRRPKPAGCAHVDHLPTMCTWFRNPIASATWLCFPERG